MACSAWILLLLRNKVFFLFCFEHVFAVVLIVVCDTCVLDDFFFCCLLSCSLDVLLFCYRSNL